MYFDFEDDPNAVATCENCGCDIFPGDEVWIDDNINIFCDFDCFCDFYEVKSMPVEEALRKLKRYE
jgi:hypothetical protein